VSQKGLNPTSVQLNGQEVHQPRILKTLPSKNSLSKSWLQQAQRRPQAPRLLPKTIAKLIFTLGSAVEGILLR
jgi:hypothetical protein